MFIDTGKYGSAVFAHHYDKRLVTSGLICDLQRAIGKVFRTFAGSDQEAVVSDLKLFSLGSSLIQAQKFRTDPSYGDEENIQKLILTTTRQL